MTQPRHEARVRRLARRSGLVLKKSRTRLPEAVDSGAYFLVDPDLNALVTHEHGLSLDEAEDLLRG